MNSKKKLVILDGFTLIFKAFYAFIKNPLKTKTGEPTSAIFGFTRMLIKLLKTYNPDYFVVALDSPTATFRHELYDQYKANRVEPPDDLKVQIPLIIQLIEKFKLSTLRMDRYEADDIIGTICHQFKDKEDLDIFVVTGDKDILQLVGDNTTILTSSKGITDLVEYDREKVKERWGVYPERIIDLFALMGDSSDNIPGVKGVGPKSALELLNNYDNIEDIYDNLDSISKKKLKENLENNKDNALLSKKLVTIDCSVPIEFNLDELSNSDINQSEGIEFLKEYQLHSILKDDIFSSYFNKEENKTKTEVKDANPKVENQIEPPSSPKGTYQAIVTQKEFKELLYKIKKAKLLSVDLETTSENPHEATVIGVAFSIEEGQGYFLPIKILGDDLFNSSIESHLWFNNLPEYDLDEQDVRKQLKEILEDPEVEKIGQNIKYDYMILKDKWNIAISPITFDTILASYVLEPGRQSHGMDFLALEQLNYKTVEYKEIVEKGKTLLDVPLPTVVDYAGEDADITLRLYNIFKPQIDNSKLKDLYYNIELPLMKVLARMELNGVAIDTQYLKKMSSEIKDRLTSLEKEIWELAGQEFNINSTKQLSEILFTKLQLKPIKKTKSGYSTDVSVLEELADEHQVPHYLLEYRKLKKLKSGYLDSIPKLINSNTKRVHTSFNQTIAQTGRLSSNNPNLQNIPIKEEVGRAIRKGFVAKNNFLIMSADYSQIELRILAHVSQDSKLINAYQNNKDIHTQTATLIFKKNDADITPDERRIAKTINFSVIYGIGATALAKDLKVPNKKAKEFIENYFNEYVGVKNYIDQQKKIGLEQGYVETLLNRIRYIPEISSNNRRDQSFGERLAVNTPIQGTSADIIKIAMINIDKAIQEKQLKSIMTIQVHDELVFEVHKDELEIMKELIIDKMENAIELSIPLKVSLSYGENWDDAH